MLCEVVVLECPECNGVNVFLRTGIPADKKKPISETYLVDTHDEVLYPRYIHRILAPEIPDNYRHDLEEAYSVCNLSPKASAALCRRILQMVLVDKYNMAPASLAQQIEGFLKSSGIPTYLSEALDAVRNVGNLAAHPLKYVQTGEIADVDPGEAEWLLEVVEALFDFAFVQPKRLAERKAQLNAKLNAIGKPSLKG